MIDLHLHTCASDGRSTPGELVGAARRRRLGTIAVTDHDTVAALDETAAACARAGLRWVPGIEITSSRDGAEVHLLGYFFDHRDPDLLAFLDAQRADRVRRVREMIDRLQRLDLPLDDPDVLGEAPLSGRSVGRPLIAAAMVRARFVQSAREAFDRYLAEGRPAFVERNAPPPDVVVALIHAAGGIASLAHPGLLGHDDWIRPMAEAGLDAIEAYYGEHPPEAVKRYRALARELDLAVTGGSDYHGHVGHGPQHPGDGTLPTREYERLEARSCSRRHCERPTPP